MSQLKALSYGMMRLLASSLNVALNGDTYHPLVAAKLIRDLEQYRGTMHIEEMVRDILTRQGVASRDARRTRAIEAWATCLDTPYRPGIERRVDEIIREIFDDE